jgi:glycosyltransferase involved in cell wall biosynthesis
MKKIVANIIGRNEADKYLSRILARVASQVDLITFTDDASDDNTAAIAKSYGARVNIMPEPTFNTNEGKLRQASWEFLESQLDPGYEWWVLAIDCDEMLYETQTEMRELIEQNAYDVIGITFFHMWNENQYRQDKAWRPHGSTRLFKYYPGGRFLDRALACGSEPTYVQQLLQSQKFMPDAGLFMKHLSYIKDEDKQEKYDRYAKIDGGAFHANAHIESILDKDPILVDWTWGGGGPE